jgi:hypothetical protein
MLQLIESKQLGVLSPIEDHLGEVAIVEPEMERIESDERARGLARAAAELGIAAVAAQDQSSRR